MTDRAVTRALARWASQARFTDLPRPVVAEAERAVLDWLGSAVAGALEPPARMARAVVRQMGRSDDATVFGADRSAAAHAAFANGIASHILELDDLHKGSTLHPAAPIISAALAVAEREQASGAGLVLAVVVGYETALRIGEAVNPSHYRFWHPTGTVATFGAAAAAGSLLGLDEARMVDALGSAGTQAAGLWEFNADGTMSKHLHPGRAAANGVVAADLARAGFTGASRILEGDRGFFRATAVDADSTRITDRLGLGWKITENCYKLHACCGHTHSAIDVALDYRAAAAGAVDQLAQVEVETYGPGYEIVKEASPRTPYQAKFSLAYCVAAALLEGAVGLDQFTPDRFGPDGPTRPEMKALLPRIAVRVTPDLSASYPAEWGTRVAFVRRDGSIDRRRAAFPKGNPENPVATAVLEAKCRALVAPRYDDAFADRVVRLPGRLRASTDVSQTMRELFESTVPV